MPFKAIEYSTLVWTDWFGHSRSLEPIVNTPPAKSGARCCLLAKVKGMAA